MMDRAAMDPVASALLAAAQVDTERARADADRAAATVLAQARRQADALLAEARTRGLADAAAVQAEARARVRGQARELLLRARRDAYERLRSQATADVVAALHDDQYADLLAHLTSTVRAALGDGATVSPAPDGGVIGQTPGIRADCSLTAFADRATDELAGELFDSGGPGGSP